MDSGRGVILLVIRHREVNHVYQGSYFSLIGEGDEGGLWKGRGMNWEGGHVVFLVD